MNRTPLLTESTHLESSLLSNYDWLSTRQIPQLESQETTESAHCVFSPLHYEAGYAYPLIVWLHGPHSNEEELFQVMPLISVRNHVAIAPRGTRRSQQANSTFGWGESAGDVAQTDQRVRHCIELAQQRFHIHSKRIFIAGFAEGGTMAHRIGMEYPDLFAGAISLSGPVPRGGRPLRHINRARKLPLLLSVSPDVNEYSNDQVTEDLKLLHHAGFSLSLRLYPEGDRLTTTMLSDANQWIMDQFCSMAPAEPA